MRPAAALALFALLLGVGSPRLLTKLPLERAPRAGVALWQATGLATLLAGMLAVLSLAIPLPAVSSDLGRFLEICVMALREAYRSPAGHLLPVAAGVVLVIVAARVVFGVALSVRRGIRLRQRHRDVLALVGRDMVGLSGGVVVDDPSPLAYCVPGRHSRIVLTAGALSALDEDELRAVVAHERAHLRGRHAWALGGADALATALPFVPAFAVARVQVARLLEMLADDAASRRHGGLAVASALVQLREARVPAGTLGAGGASSGERARRMIAGGQPLPLAVRTSCYLTALLLVAAPILVVIAPVAAAAALEYCPVGL